MTEFLKEIIQKNLGKIEENVSLQKYTTYKVGGVCRALIYPKDIDKLVEILRLIKKYKIPYKIIGNGSNLLFSDKEYNGVLLKLNFLNKLEIIGNKVIVGAGYPLIKLSLLTAKHALTGLEFASGIPGTIGGAIFMNAGAYKSDMGYITSSIKVITKDLQIITLTNNELDFHYRTSFLKKHPEYICIEATLKLNYGKKSEIEKVIKDRRERRIKSQPLEYPSAGSVFRNPEEIPAGKLIEDLGLKGVTKGGAEVSKKHANFIINAKQATAQDIKELIEYVHDTVLKEYNIDLKVEQEFVNWE
ncbi:MAG: UDP-N-acetylmuramate dehydrogenase [Bacilli bacterium]|nr:UDP-N-acetylmuramate dehydrogenase [Bacilli bacterium]